MSLLIIFVAFRRIFRSRRLSYEGDERMQAYVLLICGYGAVLTGQPLAFQSTSLNYFLDPCPWASCRGMTLGVLALCAFITLPNKSSAVDEMAAQRCTSRIAKHKMVSFREKLGEKRASAVTNQKLASFGYIFCCRHCWHVATVRLT